MSRRTDRETLVAQLHAWLCAEGGVMLILIAILVGILVLSYEPARELLAGILCVLMLLGVAAAVALGLVLWLS